MTKASITRRSFLTTAAAAACAPRLVLASGRQDGSIPFSLTNIPFSTAGSFLAANLAMESGNTRLRIQTVRKSAATYRYQTGAWSHELFEVELLRDGESLPYDVQASVDVLRLHAQDCEASIAFISADDLRVSVQGAKLCLRALREFSWMVKREPASVAAFDAPSGYRYELRGESQACVAGSARSFELHPAHRGIRASAMLCTSVEQAALAQRPTAAPSLQTWMRRCPQDIDAETGPATRTAWYLLWNLRVAPGRGYTRPTILSSKRSLSALWSWDNLFNALAFGCADPVLAWDQLRVVADHQLPSGVFPDVLNDVGPVYGFRKPPVWAWAAARLAECCPGPESMGALRELYPKIAAFHRWWFRERDLRGDGVPFYLCGNDSGWDNSTVFSAGVPVQSPDLTALLSIDAHHLSQISSRLGLLEESSAWESEAARLAEVFHRHFVRSDEVVFHEWKDGSMIERRSTSLLTRLALLLGQKLAGSVRARMVAELSDPQMFSAPCGPSSESLQSPLYDPNGYWRGPVWGPSTLLICEGLRRCSEHALAAQLAARYRGTVARHCDFRENYDARTGEGRYDSGMSWAGSPFLLLADYVRT